MDIGKLIHDRREELGLTLEAVGIAVGVSKSTVKKWENGLISNMKRDKIAQLANVLKLNPVSFIMEEEPIEPNAEIMPAQNIYMIPVFESVSAGFGAYSNSDVIDYMPLYIQNPSDVPDMLCIKVEGDSMYPKIENGDMVVVRKQSSVDSGQIAVIMIDNEEGLVKKVNYGSDYIELQSINPEYQSRVFKGKEMQRLTVVGAVKQIVKYI